MAGLAELVDRLQPPTTKELALVKCAVFWRRVSYQVTLWSLVLLILMPLLERREPDLSDPFTRFFDWIVGFVAGYLPGFLSPWLDAFRQYPLCAGLLLLLFGFTFWWGGRLRRTIADRSRFAWHMTKRPSQGALARLFWDPLAIRLSSSRLADGVWHFASSTAVPSALFAITALAVLFLVDRLYFHYRASQGEVCQSSPTTQELSKEATFDFFVNRPCTATGHRLEKGRHYAATFTIEQDWKDATLSANLGGLKRDELSLNQKIGFFLMGLGIKRVTSEPWMKPILQVGPTGFDLIPGEPYFRFVNGSPKNSMTVRFKSPANGELFLYVNDAYTGFIPVAAMLGQENPDGSLLHTYGNNVGKAQIKIEPLPAEFGD